MSSAHFLPPDIHDALEMKKTHTPIFGKLGALLGAGAEHRLFCGKRGIQCGVGCSCPQWAGESAEQEEKEAPLWLDVPALCLVQCPSEVAASVQRGLRLCRDYWMLGSGL